MPIRPLTKSDLPAILAIEEAVHISPWTKETFEVCFHAHCLGYVAEEENKVIGFIVLTSHIGESHVLNVAVHHKAQRRGVGEALLKEALAAAKQSGALIAYLEVRRSNT